MSGSTDKRTKYFRKLPLLGGLMTLYLAFFAVIPLGLFSSFTAVSPNNIPLFIFQAGATRFFLWGMVESGISIMNFSQITQYNIIPFLIWIIFLVSGILGCIGSSYNEDPGKMKKIIKLSAFFILVELFYYISVYFFWKYSINTTIIFGPGLYILGIILIIYVISAIKITNYKEIQK